MGNRAVITTKDKKIGLYLHWNGGRDSVNGFLAYADLMGAASPERDSYGWARLCQIIGNFFGGTHSVGIGPYECSDIDNGDNGVYIIEKWRIVGREYHDGKEQAVYPLEEMLMGINECMPFKDQTAPERIREWVQEHGREF